MWLSGSCPDVQFVYHCSEFYEQAGEMAAAFQAQREVDAILFTGPTNFAYARKRVSPTIPWSYLPHSRTAALQALLEAMAVHGSDLKAISVDRYEPELMRQVLEGAGIQGTRSSGPPATLKSRAMRKSSRSSTGAAISGGR